MPTHLSVTVCNFACGNTNERALKTTGLMLANIDYSTRTKTYPEEQHDSTMLKTHNQLDYLLAPSIADNQKMRTFPKAHIGSYDDVACYAYATFKHK